MSSGHRPDVVHAVVHEIDLPFAVEFADDRLLDPAVLVGHDLGDDSPAVDRGGGQRRDVTQADHRHVQRARDGRRGEREDVGGQPVFEQLVLVLDTEALLLVDDHQSEVFETDVLRQQPVRADHDVDATGGKLAQDFALFHRGLETRQRLDAERVVRHAPSEGAFVLFGEDRGRHEHRDLLAELRRLERRADRDLGLAEADVAADQPVHRAVAAHVAFDRGDRGELVLGLVVGELGLELLLPGRCPRGSAGPARSHARPGPVTGVWPCRARPRRRFFSASTNSCRRASTAAAGPGTRRCTSGSGRSASRARAAALCRRTRA